METVELSRRTEETEVSLRISFPGTGRVDLDLPVPFLRHMLHSMARHGGMDLEVRASGDVEVDLHHLVEDVGIALGRALRAYLERVGFRVARFGFAAIPMDEALVLLSLDLCGRPTLAYGLSFEVERCGDFPLELLREFFKALSDNAGCALHLVKMAGVNAHHVAEASFKALGVALRQAMSPAEGPRSTKGSLGV